MFTGIVREVGRVASVGGGDDGLELVVEGPATAARVEVGGSVSIDGVGAVRSVEPEGDGTRVVVSASSGILRYCVEKGSIAVDGVSLTVASLDGDSFSVALIPHTLAGTTLGELEPGREVNLEVDVLAKYVERLLNRD